MSTAPITYLTTPEQQHLLFLCLPLKEKPSLPKPKVDLASALGSMLAGKQLDGTTTEFDSRPATGVHFTMSFAQWAPGVTPWFPAPSPPPPFPIFQVPPPSSKGKRNLLVVMAIYDADFGPYIGAFTNSQAFSALLDLVLLNLDETDFVSDDDPTSAVNILANNGTYANPDALVQLLMRYNHADPTAPITAIFPGLTDTKILKTSGGYPNANQLWPLPQKKIVFAPSVPPPKPRQP
jgi:hypothetical protein